MNKLNVHDTFIRSIMSDKQIAKDYFKSDRPAVVMDKLDWIKVRRRVTICIKK